MESKKKFVLPLIEITDFNEDIISTSTNQKYDPYNLFGVDADNWY